MPKLAGLALAQFAQLPVVTPGLLSAALDDALLGQGMQRASAEDRGADAAIQAIQDIVPTAVRDELGDCARAHASPVGVPAAAPTVDGDLALGRLVVRVGFGWAVAPPEVLKEHGYRIEARRPGDHQLRDCGALNLQRRGDLVFCRHGESLPGHARAVEKNSQIGY